MYSLGIDIGSSSIKVSVLDIEKGVCLSSCKNPRTEMPMSAPFKGFAEQSPEMWWQYVCDCLGDIALQCDLSKIVSIGISYQMHGLVMVDKDVNPLRDAIIWCDSRAVEIGNQAMEDLGPDMCLEHLLNSPGNFTASKLAWVKRNEMDAFAKVWKFMLPGDYIAYKFSGEVNTTETGLSEQILWDFKENKRADFVADYFGIPTSRIPDVAPSIGVSCRTTKTIEEQFGIPEGTPISYRAGDQPNNAFSLNVLNPGEVAATGGTSGVFYGVTDLPKADLESRVNTFLHVNHSVDSPRLGVLLCINGTGIMNSWVHRNVTPGQTYNQMNVLAKSAPVGSDGLIVLPFGNGAERMLGNKYTGAKFLNLDLVRHTSAHVLRATQEGIAFSFRYGLDIMKELGIQPSVIRAGKANLFLSSTFRSTLATICDTTIELFDTDGALGAARGAALGAGYYPDVDQAFANLEKLETIEPERTWKETLEENYRIWKQNID